MFVNIGKDILRKNCKSLLKIFQTQIILILYGKENIYLTILDRENIGS